MAGTQKEEAVQVAEKMRQEGKWPEAKPPPAEELPPQWEDLTPEQKERFSLNVRKYSHAGDWHVFPTATTPSRTFGGWDEPYKRTLPRELRGVGATPKTIDLEDAEREDEGLIHKRGLDPSKTLGEDTSFTGVWGADDNREMPTVVQGVEGGETPEEAYAIRRKRLDDMAQRAEEIGGRYGTTGFFPHGTKDFDVAGAIQYDERGLVHPEDPRYGESWRPWWGSFGDDPELPRRVVEDWTERYNKAAGLKEDSGISWMDLAELVDTGRLTVKPELQNLLEEAKRMDRDLEEMRQLYKSYRAAEPELALLEQEFPELKKEAMKRIMDKNEGLLPEDESTDLDKE